MKNNAAPHLNQFYQFNYCSIPLWIWFQLRASIFFTWKPPRPWWNLKLSAEICTKTEVAVMMSGGEMPMLTVLRSSWSPIFSGRFSRHAWWLNPYFGWQSPYDFPHIFSTSENWNSQQISHWLPLMSSYSPRKRSQVPSEALILCEFLGACVAAAFFRITHRQEFLPLGPGARLGDFWRNKNEQNMLIFNMFFLGNIYRNIECYIFGVFLTIFCTKIVVDFFGSWPPNHGNENGLSRCFNQERCD